MNAFWQPLINIGRRFKLPCFLISTPGALLTLAAACLVAYAPFIPWLSLYLDDWTFLWTGQILQLPGEIRYFFIGNNRPVWGLFYQFFVPLIGAHPWVWHLFGIFWLWVCAALVYALVRVLLPEQKTSALLAGLLFALYPGMQIQFISLCFGHMWLVYAALLGSLTFSLLALRQPRHYVLFSTLGVLTSAINLLSFEYFIMLDLLRPLLLWWAAGAEISNPRQRLLKTARHALPYLLLFSGVIFWRFFLFPLQTLKYPLNVLNSLRVDPLGTLGGLAGTATVDALVKTPFLPWVQSFWTIFDPVQSGLPVWLSALLMAGLGLVFTGLLWKLSTGAQERRAVWPLTITGLLGLFLAGWPFWLTGLQIEVQGIASRFTMPFIPGAALLLAGLFSLLRPRWLRAALPALLLAGAVVLHLSNAQVFRRDTTTNQHIFWQLNWRIPALPAGTFLLTNDLPMTYATDNTLSAELNWAAAGGQAGYRADYGFFFTSEMERFKQAYQQPGEQIQRDLMSITYQSSTHIVALAHAQGTLYEGACLRVLDPNLDPVNPMLDPVSRANAAYSDPSLIQLQADRSWLTLPAELFGAEPTSYACRAFQLADLAHQRGDWLGVIAQRQNMPDLERWMRRDPMYGVIFINAYTHLGQTDEAIQMTRTISSVTPANTELLCRVWQTLTALPATQMKAELDCR